MRLFIERDNWFAQRTLLWNNQYPLCGEHDSKFIRLHGVQYFHQSPFSPADSSHLSGVRAGQLTISHPSSKTTFSQAFKEKYVSKVVRIGCMINLAYNLSKLWKVMFFILCEVMFRVRLQGKFEIDPRFKRRTCGPVKPGNVGWRRQMGAMRGWFDLQVLNTHKHL